MASSSIEWTQSTWNPITGCTKVSPGCKHCYAERFSKRLMAMGVPKYSMGFDVVVHENALSVPLRWKKPRRIFVNSMSDLFHDKVPFEFIEKVFDVMAKADWHQFQVLTKRSERLAEIGSHLNWSSNVWMGVSVEEQKYSYRVDHLRGIGAKVKFLSLEPLLGPLPTLDLSGIDWVIVGGESGPGARPMLNEWVVDIRDLCLENNVPFFFKQWGGTNKKKAGRFLENREWNNYPEINT